MRRAAFIVSAVMALSVMAVSCGDRAKVIPRGKLAKIYAEMFIADQWAYSDFQNRRMADTLLVYEPIFEKYGFTSDDYRKSMEYYIKDPDRYARILRVSSVIIEDRIKELKKEKEMLKALSETKAATDAFIPEKIYFLTGMADRDLLTVDSISFFIDSTGGQFMFDIQKGYDTLFAGPRIVICRDTAEISLAVDSVAVPAVAVDKAEPADKPLKADNSRLEVDSRMRLDRQGVRQGDMFRK